MGLTPEEIRFRVLNAIPFPKMREMVEESDERVALSARGQWVEILTPDVFDLTSHGMTPGTAEVATSARSVRRPTA
jgi:hypothetical protein